MIQDLLRLTQEDASCRRKLHSSFRAEQQFNAEFLFEIENGLADRRLGNVQAAGGFAVVQVMSYTDKVPKMSKLHNRRLSRNPITTSESYDFRDGKNGAIQLADKSEMKMDNGSHGEQSSGSRSEAKLSARTYGELQRQLHKDLLAQHPEWIDADGNCPTCDDYERRLAQLISIFKSQAKLRRVKKPAREKE
jgi:hypothetical protein